MASLATEPPPPSPSAKSRRRAGAFITAFVLLQFAVPLSYLGRHDASDERFTWRRFMGSSAPACETSAWIEQVDGQRRDLSLESLIAQEWVDYVQHDRHSVVQAFLQRQCQASDAARIDLINHCDDVRGTHEYSLQCSDKPMPASVRTATR